MGRGLEAQLDIQEPKTRGMGAFKDRLAGILSNSYLRFRSAISQESNSYPEEYILGLKAAQGVSEVKAPVQIPEETVEKTYEPGLREAEPKVASPKFRSLGNYLKVAGAVGIGAIGAWFEIIAFLGYPVDGPITSFFAAGGGAIFLGMSYDVLTLGGYNTAK